MSGANRAHPPPLLSTGSLNQMVVLHNPIRLTAISNYKLAQLTFAAPDSHSMRKTALVKNMLEALYQGTPPELLAPMTRWVFFTPESMSDMTQERLEDIFSQYAHIMDAFQPLDTDNDQDAERVWVGHYMSGEDSFDDDIREEGFANTSGRSTMPEQSIFSQPCAALSLDSFSPPVQQQQQQSTLSALMTPPPSFTSSLADKPLPKRPSEDKPRRKSLTPTLRSRKSNRLSWTSDMGLVAPTITQNMASELMTCFDMDFSVDIKLNTAPKLPELPFPSTIGPNGTPMKRFSNDSLMGLIPKFETFTLEEDPKPKRKSRLSQSWSRTPDGTYQTITNPPARSSSLQYRRRIPTQTAVAEGASSQLPATPKTRNRSRSSEFLAHLLGTSSSSPSSASEKEKKQKSHTLPRVSSKPRKSVRKLATFMKSGSKKNRATQSSPTLPTNPNFLVVPQGPNHSQRSLDSVESITSSWSSSSEVEEDMVAHKTSVQKTQKDQGCRPSLSLAQPVLLKSQYLHRARSLEHSRYPATASNVKDDQIRFEEQSIVREKQALEEEVDPVVEEHRHHNTFVKRMATLGRRMRIQRSM